MLGYNDTEDDIDVEIYEGRRETSAQVGPRKQQRMKHITTR